MKDCCKKTLSLLKEMKWDWMYCPQCGSRIGEDIISKLQARVKQLEDALIHVDCVLDVDDGYGLNDLQEYIRKIIKEQADG